MDARIDPIVRLVQPHFVIAAVPPAGFRRRDALRLGVLGKVLVLTVAVRGLKYIGLLILFYSVAGGSFPQLLEIGNLKILAAMIASEMTATLPIPTLMSFGAWEVGGMTFMALFGAAPQESLIALIALHIQTQAVDYGLGLAALYLLFSPGGLTARAKSGSGSVVAATTFSIIALMGLVGSWYWFQDQSDRAATASNPRTLPLDQRPPWMQSLSGFVVWSSNRSGDHNIMLMDLSNLSMRQLTSHPHTETHPRISPDGKRIAFIRSIREWQSWRSQRPWNIWVMDIETGKEEMIVESGTAPTWSKDGETVYFNRTIGEVWAYDVRSGAETRLYSRNTNGLPDEEFFWPSINDQGHLAVSYRDRGRPTTLVAQPDGRHTVVARGCMLTWSPDNAFAVFVSNEDGGNQQNQFNRYDPVTGTISEWLDLPGELSHEYFPRLDASQRYLVFAASNGAHEPDIEDYEIMLWKTDTPAEQAQRLTFDRGNDSWPDIYMAQIAN